jgi:methylmalonyl-CoA mutase cobalamin-binding subunit
MSMPARTLPCQTANKRRFVIATSLFDGHDAAINIMRRTTQTLFEGGGRYRRNM